MIIRCEMWTGPTLVKEYAQAIRLADMACMEGTENVYWDVEVSGVSNPGAAIHNTSASVLRLIAKMDLSDEESQYYKTLANVISMYAKEKGPPEVPFNDPIFGTLTKVKE